MTEDATPPAQPDPPSPSAAETPGPAETPSPAGAAPAAPALPVYKPSYAFLAVVSIISLAADLGTKMWAKARLEDTGPFHDHHSKGMTVIKDHLSFIYTDNPGGAFGLLGKQPEWLRRPFFLVVSALAIAFIVSLYRKLTPQQTALKWGLPLVLGGALGNLVNRIQYNSVIDFIDIRADWIRPVMGIFSRPSDHWPTFNIADVTICMGVGLMAIDMFTSRKQAPRPAEPPASPPTPPPPPVTEGT